MAVVVAGCLWPNGVAPFPMRATGQFFVGFLGGDFPCFWHFGFGGFPQIFIERFVVVGFRLHSSSCFSGIDITGGRSREAGARNPSVSTCRARIVKKKKKKNVLS